MSRLRIHDLSKSCEAIELERTRESAVLSDTEKIRRTLVLINTMRQFNGGKPLKEPQGKGFVSYPKHD